MVACSNYHPTEGPVQDDPVQRWKWFTLRLKMNAKLPSLNSTNLSLMRVSSLTNIDFTTVSTWFGNHIKMSFHLLLILITSKNSPFHPHFNKPAPPRALVVITVAGEGGSLSTPSHSWVVQTFLAPSSNLSKLINTLTSILDTFWIRLDDHISECTWSHVFRRRF